MTIVVATRNREEQLVHGLRSLERYRDQNVFVVDDGSVDRTQSILSTYPQFVNRRIERDGPYRKNPGPVFNIGHQEAWNEWPDDEIHLEQGGEVCHLVDCVTPLVEACEPGVVAIATCYNGPVDEMLRMAGILSRGDYPYAENDVVQAKPATDGNRVRVAMVSIGGFRFQQYTGRHRQMPFMFLGAIHRKDWMGAGGYDETIRVGNDQDLAERLIMQGVRFRFVERAVAWHLSHGKS